MCKQSTVFKPGDIVREVGYTGSDELEDEVTSAVVLETHSKFLMLLVETGSEEVVERRFLSRQKFKKVGEKAPNCKTDVNLLIPPHVSISSTVEVYSALNLVEKDVLVEYTATGQKLTYTIDYIGKSNVVGTFVHARGETEEVLNMKLCWHNWRLVKSHSPKLFG